MLDKIHEANPRAAIVCVLGQMGANPLLVEKIQSNVESYRTRYPDSKITYHQFKYCDDPAPDGHPGAASHKRDAEELTAQIRELLK